MGGETRGGGKCVVGPLGMVEGLKVGFERATRPNGFTNGDNLLPCDMNLRCYRLYAT